MTLLGARRHLRDALMSDDKWIAEKALRQASNFEIQSAGAELTKRALARIWKSDILYRTNSRFMFPVHDEVVGSVHKDDAVEFIRVFHEAISQPYTPDFPVPFVGSISIGLDFGRQIELGEVFDEEKIRQAIAELFEEVVPA
jgi:DNA polymerase I-like protein with 3'-5' exonuclease and polymerase domains